MSQNSVSETILIIGGAGQIGTSLTKQELAAGKDVHVVGRSAATSSKLDFITKAANGHYTSLDISSDSKKLATLINTIKPEKIYFFAEPFPMNAKELNQAGRQMAQFYSTLAQDVGYKGPVVVIGTAGIEGTGKGFPLLQHSAQASKVYNQIPYFQARQSMVQISRHYANKGLDIRRLALPWVVSGDAHHGKLEALPVMAAGGFDMIGLPDIKLDTISGAEAARAARFIAEKGESGWTYQAGGVPYTPIAAVMQTELAAIDVTHLKTKLSSPNEQLNRAQMFLNFKATRSNFDKLMSWNPLYLMARGMMDGYIRSQFNVAAGTTMEEAQIHAATACALMSVLPQKADMWALIKLGFKPTDQKTQWAEIKTEALRHAALLVREGVVSPAGKNSPYKPKR